MLPNLLRNQYQAEIVVKLTLSLLEAHHGPIVASQELLPQLEEIKDLAFQQIFSLRVCIYIQNNYLIGTLQNVSKYLIFINFRILLDSIFMEWLTCKE